MRAPLPARRPRLARTRDGRRPRRSAPRLLELVAAWQNNPAVVYNRAYDVLAANNAIADALFSGWRHSRNLVRTVVTDRPHEASLEIKWLNAHISIVQSFGRDALRPVPRLSTRARAGKSCTDCRVPRRPDGPPITARNAATLELFREP
ncbi:MmyB family transcriptional regulator [Nocardia xishanensis]|uniref:MmyB family transcriptional regulator n=1 Tax=Nocardia xishanensis TaxID=238964 RepID=UPI003F54007A